MNLVTGFLPRKMSCRSRPSIARFMMDKVAQGLWSTSRFRATIILSVFHNHSLLNSNNIHLLGNIYIYIYTYIYVYIYIYTHIYTLLFYIRLFPTYFGCVWAVIRGLQFKELCVIYVCIHYHWRVRPMCTSMFKILCYQVQISSVAVIHDHSFIHHRGHNLILVTEGVVKQQI
jgi:hypothetical protein